MDINQTQTFAAERILFNIEKNFLIRGFSHMRQRLQQ